MKKLILLIIAISFSIGFLNINVYANQSEPKVIKVGYMLNYGTIKSPVSKGSEGYGYEYLNNIFKYAEGDYELEFVYCKWEECVEKLANGEIDMIGPITFNEKNESRYLFPKENFGDNIIFLSTLEENGIHFNSYEDIDNSTIAVQVDNPNEYMLHEFLEEHDLNAEIVYFSDSDYSSVLKNFDYDFCLSSSLQTFNDLVPVATLGDAEFYYVTDIKNKELLDVINDGMKKMDKNEILYQEKLYLKYYDYSIKSANLPTQKEYDTIKSHGVYKVGVADLASPICRKNSNGEFEGAVISALEQFSQIAEIKYELVDLTGVTNEELLQSVDFSLICNEKDLREKFVESNNYFSMPCLLIDNASVAEPETIGFLKFYGVSEDQRKDSLFDREIVLFDDLDDMQNSYNSGEIDSILVSTYTLNLIRDNFNDSQYISLPMDFDLNFSFIYSENFSDDSIEIFNKIIAQMDKTKLESSALKYSSPNPTGKFDIVKFMQENVFVVLILVILIAVIITAINAKRKQKLAKILNQDELTGFATLHKFISDAQKIISKSSNNIYSIISIDIDNFKYINEFYGYQKGTDVLLVVANNIKHNIQNSKILCRANADNFLLLVQKGNIMKSIDHSIKTDNGLHLSLKEYMDQNYDITFSIGVYDIVDKNLDFNFMIDCANTARELGKNTAHTTVNKFTAEMDSARIRNNDIVANMVTALAENEFVLYYQPKIDLKTGKMSGAEALIRWIKNGKMISPIDFIPLFERNGFIEEIDYFVLENACRFLSQNPNSVKISVNISGATIIKPDFDTKIINIVNKYKVPYSKIDIEITETAFVEQLEQSIEKFENLRKLGFSISMDDFGAGISSLNRLKNIPLDILKIDREFIIDSIENPRGAKIIKSIINMSKDLGLETVAEGIETCEQKDFLKNLGCDVGQGYYFHRPMPQNEFKELFKL